MSLRGTLRDYGFGPAAIESIVAAAEAEEGERTRRLEELYQAVGALPAWGAKISLRDVRRAWKDIADFDKATR